MSLAANTARGRTARRSSATAAAWPEANFDARQREQGYRAAMAKYAPAVALNIVAGDFSEESGYRAGHELLARATRPRAVFAANDMMAVGCLAAFKDAGVRVPEDIALAGFDDIPIARYVTPALSTVRVRIADFGRLALERLAQVVEHPGQESPSADTLGFEIVVRDTCGGIKPEENS
jgi:LacI family transcriptional regulator